MNAGARVASFVLALGVVFGVGAALGQAVGPIDVGGSDDHHPATSVAADHEGHTP